jgi:hypothetical protein
LAQWEESVTWHGGVTTLVGGEVAPRRGNGGDDASWGDTNLTGPKNKENPRGRLQMDGEDLKDDELIFFKKTYASEI